jgi:hypothetical protein
LKRENLQEKKIECALDQIRWFAHGLSSVTESMIHKLPSVSKGNVWAKAALSVGEGSDYGLPDMSGCQQAAVVRIDSLNYPGSGHGK